MSNFKIFLRDGKLWGNEFPEEPSQIFTALQESEWWDRYYEAVEAAKASAMEIINPVSGALYEPMEEGKLYDPPKGWTVEYEDTMSPGWVPSYNDPDNRGLAEPAEPIRIARLIPSKASGIVATGIADPQPGKGDKGGECNRASCQQKGAMFYNHSTRKYYCTGCASLINEHNHADAMEIYGHALCTLDSYVSPVIPEGSEKEDIVKEMITKGADTEVNKWLETVSEELYMLVSRIEKEMRYNPGTRAKMILAMEIEVIKKSLTDANEDLLNAIGCDYGDSEGNLYRQDFNMSEACKDALEAWYKQHYISIKSGSSDKPAIDDTLKESDATYREQQMERLAEIESVIKASHNAAIDKVLHLIDLNKWCFESTRSEKIIVEGLEKLKL